jgi:hypothetical protein
MTGIAIAEASTHEVSPAERGLVRPSRSLSPRRGTPTADRATSLHNGQHRFNGPPHLRGNMYGGSIVASTLLAASPAGRRLSRAWVAYQRANPAREPAV